METNGKAKILYAPNLIIQRGKEGSIVTGEEVPILSQTTSSGGVTTSTEFKSVGIKLSVTPTMISGDRVRVEVNPEVSTVIGYSVAGEVANPIIAVRQARTELEVRDGQLISMAGLLQSTDRDTERRTPVLSNIPILGALFTSRRDQSQQTQLIIFLSINILEFGEGAVIRPDRLDPRIDVEMERIEQEQSGTFPDASLKRDVDGFMKHGLIIRVIRRLVTLALWQRCLVAIGALVLCLYLFRSCSPGTAEGANATEQLDRFYKVTRGDFNITVTSVQLRTV